MSNSDQATKDGDLLSQVIVEWMTRLDEGETVDSAEFIKRYPQIADELGEYLSGVEQVKQMAGRKADSLVQTVSTSGITNSSDVTESHATVLEHSSDVTDIPSKAPERFGHFSIVRKLGTGGMGNVYLAEDERVGRQVALKIPKVDGSLQQEILDRFQREASTAGNLRHPHICPVYDFGEFEGQQYLSMAYIEGESLDVVLREHGPFSAADAVALVQKLALALQAAHEGGVMHRDLKPSNILIGKDGEPVLTDFGLARRLTSDPQEIRLTQEGTLMGTPAYMSPEQARGADDVGLTTDIYSLGVIFYELLTGRLPFSGDMVSVLAKIQRDDPTSPSSVCEGLDQRLDSLCLKMLAKDPGERPQTMEIVAEELTDCLLSDPHQSEGSADEAALATTLAQVPSHRTERRWPYWGLGTLAAIALVAFAVITFVFQTEDGMIRITVDDADTKVLIDDGVVIVTRKNSAQPISLTAGRHKLRVRHGDVEFDTTELEISDGDKIALKVELLPGKIQILQGQKILGSKPLSNGNDTLPNRDSKPISLMPLVSRPGEIPGVESWTIETRGHRGDVNSIVFKPDGKQFASAGGDCGLRIRDVASGKLVRALAGHDYPVRSIDWSPDGKWIASCSHGDEMGLLWDAESGKLVRHLSPKIRMTGVAFSADNKTIALADLDGPIQLVDVIAGNVIRTLENGGGSASALAWSPNGTQLAATSAHGHSIFIWEFVTGIKQLTLAGHEDRVRYIEWSPTGNSLVSTSSDATVRVWDAKTGKLIRKFEDFDNRTQHALAYSKDGESLFLGGGKYRRVIIATGQELWSTNRPAGTESRAMAWAPTGEFILSGDSHGFVHYWDADSGKLVKTLSGHGKSMTTAGLSPDGKTLAASASQFTRGIELWDVTTGKSAGRLHQGEAVPSCLNWSPNGHLISTFNSDELVRVWDVSKKEIVSRLSDAVTYQSANMTFSPDGRLIAVPDRKHEIRLWDVVDNKVRQQIVGSMEPIRAMAWSPDGKSLLVCNIKDPVAQIWDAATGELRQTTLKHRQSLNCLAWSPKGASFATGTIDGEIHLWNTETGEMFDEFTVLRNSYPFNIHWMPDGETLVVFHGPNGHTYKQVFVWNLKESREVRTFHANWWTEKMPSFAPDGRTLAIGWNNTVRFWDAATGRRHGALAVLGSNSQISQWVSFAATGHYRVSHPSVEGELVYLVKSKAGQKVMSPAEFQSQFKWQNDPDKVRFYDLPSQLEKAN